VQSELQASDHAVGIFLPEARLNEWSKSSGGGADKGEKARIFPQTSRESEVMNSSPERRYHARACAELKLPVFTFAQKSRSSNGEDNVGRERRYAKSVA